MDMTVADVSRVQVQYIGNFAEPAFHVLGNPPPLYSNLLKHLRPYGVGIADLKIDLSVLAQANVTCALPLNAGLIRVYLNRLEVFIPEAKTITQVSQLIKHTW